VVKRIECPECGRLCKPVAQMRLNPVLNKKICWHCDKKIGHNKFYNPKINGSKQKIKFMRLTMNEDEKNELWQSLIRIGLSEEQARIRVRNLQNRLFWQQRNRMFNQNKTQSELNKNFLAGLGQLK
jgi:hypothetical protein